MINKDYEKEQALEQRIAHLEEKIEQIKVIFAETLAEDDETVDSLMSDFIQEGENNAPTDPAA